MTVPCPPNPAKARKLAQIRKMKEEKMKTPIKLLPPPPPPEVKDKQEERRKMLREQQRLALNPETEDEVEKPPSPTKWYMGEYAHNDGK